MRNLVVVLIGLFVFVGCSKSSNEVTTEDEAQQVAIEILQQAKILAKDSSNLTIMSYSDNRSSSEDSDKVFFLGKRENKFWVGIFPLLDTPDEGFDIGKELCSYTTSHDYKLTRQIGYGETFTINSISVGIWGDLDKREFEMCIIGKENEFLDATTTVDFIIVRKDQEHYYEDCGYYNAKMEWYDSSMLFWNDFSHKATLYSSNGIKIYDLNDFYWLDFEYGMKNLKPVNLEEGICCKDDFICRLNIKNYDGYLKNEVWRANIIEQLGLDEDQKPKLAYHFENKQNNYWFYNVDVLNYDGSKETRDFKINIETGEIINL